MEKIKINDSSNDRKYFTIVPNYILNHSTLWDREVYIQMKRIAGESGTCWMSQKNLSKQCGMSLNRLKKSIKYLTLHKWVRFLSKKKIGTKGGNQTVNEYAITDLWDLNNNFYKEGGSLDDTPIPQRGVTKTSKGCHENAKGVSPEGYKEEPLNKNNKEDVFSLKNYLIKKKIIRG